MQVLKQVGFLLGVLLLVGRVAYSEEAYNRLTILNADGAEIAAIERQGDHFRLVTCQITDDNEKVTLGTLEDCATKRKGDPRCLHALSAPLSEAELDFLMRLPAIESARAQVAAWKEKRSAYGKVESSVKAKKSTLVSLESSLRGLRSRYRNETCSITRSGIYDSIQETSSRYDRLQEEFAKVSREFDSLETVTELDVRQLSQAIDEESCDLTSLLLQLQIKSVTRKHDSVDGAKLLALIQRLVERRSELDVFKSRESFPLSSYAMGDQMYQGRSQQLRSTVYERSPEDYVRMTGAADASGAERVAPGLVQVTCGSRSNKVSQLGVSTSHALWLLGERCNPEKRIDSTLVGNGLKDLE